MTKVGLYSRLLRTPLLTTAHLILWPSLQHVLVWVTGPHCDAWSLEERALLLPEILIRALLLTEHFWLIPSGSVTGFAGAAAAPSVYSANYRTVLGGFPSKWRQSSLLWPISRATQLRWSCLLKDSSLVMEISSSPFIAYGALFITLGHLPLQMHNLPFIKTRFPRASQITN